MAKPFKVTQQQGPKPEGGDGERAIAAPSLWPPRPLAVPSSYEGEAHGHSPLVPWPKPGGADDNKPFRRLK